MNVPLRALSWVTRFFWIIVLAFAVTCAYSATLIRVNFGQPVMTSTGEDFTITLPIIFDNRGYYNIADFNVTTYIADYENRGISKATTCIVQIRPQNNANIFHGVSFSQNEIMTRADYLFNDSNFTLYGSIHLNYANLIPFGFETNKTIPWGAPLFNFTIGMPEYSTYDTAHLRINVPINFQNHSPYFSVTGTIHVEIFNSRGQLIGEGTPSIDVPSNADYDDEIGMLVNTGMFTGRGQIRVNIRTEMFDYGPMVINYG
jgi:hypothetical protein